MKKIIFLFMLSFISFNALAEYTKVVKDKDGVYTSTSSDTTKDKATGNFYKDKEGKHAIYKSARGKYYVYKVSKKSGKTYKKYLQI